MASDMSTEETTVVATYSNRHDAEVAKSFLEDHGISSFVVADDVHPPIQLTGGVRLFVMSSEGRSARRALVDADMAGDQPVERKDDTREHLTGHADNGLSKPARATSWVYITIFLLVTLAVVAGLLI